MHKLVNVGLQSKGLVGQVVNVGRRWAYKETSAINPSGPLRGRRRPPPHRRPLEQARQPHRLVLWLDIGPSREAIDEHVKVWNVVLFKKENIREDIPHQARAIVYMYMCVTLPYKRGTQTPVNPKERDQWIHLPRNICLYNYALTGKGSATAKGTLTSPRRPLIYFPSYMGIYSSQQDPKPKHVETYPYLLLLPTWPCIAFWAISDQALTSPMGFVSLGQLTGQALCCEQGWHRPYRPFLCLLWCCVDWGSQEKK